MIENGLTEISAQAFYGDTALDSISIPESVTTIGARAFGGCTGLSQLTIPDSVTEIADNAFEGAANLVIYCTQDSYALQYARANAISYVITDANLIGDVDLDGYVTITDVTKIQMGLAGLTRLSDLQIRLADVSGDGLDIADATQIQRFLAGFEDPYHIGTSFISA